MPHVISCQPPLSVPPGVSDLAGVLPGFLKVPCTDHTVVDGVVVETAGVAQSVGDQLDLGIQELSGPFSLGKGTRVTGTTGTGRHPPRQKPAGARRRPSALGSGGRRITGDGRKAPSSLPFSPHHCAEPRATLTAGRGLAHALPSLQRHHEVWESRGGVVTILKFPICCRRAGM